MEIKQHKIQLFLYIFISAVGSCGYGQVTIGTAEPAEKAILLQLKTYNADTNNSTTDKGGLVLPKVKLEDTNSLMPFIVNDVNFQNNVNNVKDLHTGLMVYNLTSSMNNTIETKRFSKGLYIWNGNQWSIVNKYPVRYFYPPAFNLPLPRVMTSQDPVLTFDLYEVYEKQFNKTNNTSGSYDKDQWVSTNSTIDRVPSPTTYTLYTRTQLDYAIIYYDKEVIYDVSINNQGIMSYRVKDDNPPTTSFINLVFVVK